MRWFLNVLRMFAQIVGFTVFFYTLLYLCLTLLSIYNPEFKNWITKMNEFSALEALVVFISLLIGTTIYFVLARAVTGRWPMMFDPRNEIALLRNDVSSIRNSINSINGRLNRMNGRLRDLEGRHKRIRKQTGSRDKGKNKKGK